MSLPSSFGLEVLGVGQDCSGEAFVDLAMARYREEHITEVNLRMVPAFAQIEREAFGVGDVMEPTQQILPLHFLSLWWAT